VGVARDDPLRTSTVIQPPFVILQKVSAHLDGAVLRADGLRMRYGNEADYANRGCAGSKRIVARAIVQSVE
jgi:hypothetical protein